LLHITTSFHAPSSIKHFWTWCYVRSSTTFFYKCW